MQHSGSNNLFLSVVIPAFNEASRIEKTLASIRQYLDGKDYNYEVIVSDDGSADDTVAVVKNLATSWDELRVVVAPHNEGKGAAVKRGVLASAGDLILFTDADNATPIEEVEKLLSHTQHYDIVFGSRHIPGATIHISQAVHRVILSRLSNLLIRILAVPGVYDTQCGFKLFKKGAAQAIFEVVTLSRFGFDIEVLAIAKSWGLPAKEVGINWYNDFDSRVRAGREAIRTLKDLFKIKWNLIRGVYGPNPYAKAASNS